MLTRNYKIRIAALSVLFIVIFTLFIQTIFLHVNKFKSYDKAQEIAEKQLPLLHSLSNSFSNSLSQSDVGDVLLNASNLYDNVLAATAYSKELSKLIPFTQVADQTKLENLGNIILKIQTGKSSPVLNQQLSLGANLSMELFLQTQKNLYNIKSEKNGLLQEIKITFILMSILIVSSILLVIYLFKEFSAGKLKSSKSLEASRNRILDLYDNAPCGYHSLDKNGLIIEMNQTELNWLGYAREEIIEKRKFIEFISPESKKIFDSNFPSFINNTAVRGLEIELVRKDGSTFFVQVNASAVLDSEGNFEYSRSVMMDITERRKNEFHLNYLNSIVEQSSDAIISTDAGMIIKSWNKGAERMYGYTAKEVINQEGAQFMHSILNKDLVKKIISQVCETGHWQGESQQYRKDGSVINVLSSLAPVRQTNGVLTGFISINQDISSHKLYEDQLKQFNKELSLKVIEKTNEITQTLDRISDGFIAFDKEWKFLMINQQAEQMLNMQTKDVLGKVIWDIYPDLESHPLFEAMKEAMETQKHKEIEEYFSPEEKWLYESIYPSVNGVTIIMKDRTDVHHAEIREANSERKYKLLFRNNPLPMWMVMWPSTQILDVNESAIQKYGYTREEFLTFGTIDLLTPEDRERLMKCLDKPADDIKNPGSWKHRKKDGTVIDVEINTHEIVMDDHVALLVLAIEVTEKILAEEALLNSNNQLRKLSEHLEKIREEERTFIAREIHDELGQQLTGLKMDISWLLKKVQLNDSSMVNKSQEILHLIDDTMKTVRRIATELRPGILDDLGLIAALQWQSQEFSKRTGIICHFNTDLHDQKYDQQIATGIFRIFQESLTNVARHASAGKVNSSLSLNENNLILIVEDDGIGFSMEEKQQPQSLGLLGMRERAHSMKGALSISSVPGAGTKIKLTTPFAISETTILGHND